MYDRIVDELRQSYDLKVEERDATEVSDWKLKERQQFLALLQSENKTRLLDIGAGTGVHGMFYQESGLEVVCTDLSSEMVKRCRRKGLDAHVMDFLHLDFPDESFDAVHALNCLLHVPSASLSRVLLAIRDLLRPGGLFYWGQYGGIAHEGVHAGDHYEPKRFFCLLQDTDIIAVGSRHFRLVRFGDVALEGDRDIHFQSMVWRRGGDPGNAEADTRG